ncbi:MAG: sugar transferase [Actinomycetota bacterium]|nr:sugar transferase [Actinomycetota bacterium]
MTPPVQEHALEAPAIGAFGSYPVATRRGVHAWLDPSDVVALVDIWVLLATLVAARVVAGGLTAGMGAFGIAALASVVAPGFFRRNLTVGALDDAGEILRNIGLSYAFASFVTLLLGLGDVRGVAVVATAVTVSLLVGRVAGRAVERSLRRSATSSTVVVGGGAIARHVISTLKAHREYGLDVIGVVDDDPMFGVDELGARVLGATSTLSEVVRARGVDVVIIAYGSTQQKDMVDEIRSAMEAGAQVWVVPRFFELGSAANTNDHLWGLPVVRLQPPARSRPAWIAKRAVDFVLAALATAISAPVVALIAAAIYVESRGPILLRQVRVSLDGRPFTLYKFRSMHVRETEVEDTEWAADEQRMTRVGRFLRNTSLDELPQLFNVLRGDMSLVGPRPERPYFVELFKELYPNYDARHRLPAGITGWAQIHGLKGDTSIEERAAFDNYYVENWSLSQDMKILLKTVGTFFRG